jgi:hypothetical protein
MQGVARTDRGTDLSDMSVHHRQIALLHPAFAHHAGIANQRLARQS